MLLRSETSISRKRPFAESDQNNLALFSSSRDPKRLKVDQNATTPTATRPRRQKHSRRIRQHSAQSAKSKKRQIDEASGINPSPAKKAHLACTDSEEPEEAHQGATNIVQQPKPLPPKRPYATFLEDSIESPSNLASGKYRLDSVDSFVTAWVVDTSLLSQSYRERHCRSDSVLGSSNSDFIPRRLTKSAPNMDSSQDAKEFIVPPTPPLSRSFRADAEDDSQIDSQVGSQASFYAESVAQTEVTSSGRSSGKLVEDSLY
ncbi:hypothetical protein K469DRAFT_707479 [Zopfia rhizophila CBS 207.26]|uniref:Uncharacterized protein n=1 Tax=Zopfia rhizophila CBS 207.26 TaxID=1314779 RepID=A0A6A6E4Y6_9PEZI|nr:hypothetical protein K469DRAFT_707479 [Zopfia rhizophila CBS 207.26]